MSLNNLNCCFLIYSLEGLNNLSEKCVFKSHHLLRPVVLTLPLPFLRLAGRPYLQENASSVTWGFEDIFRNN